MKLIWSFVVSEICCLHLVFQNFIEVYSCLGESHIMEPMGPPPVAGPFTTVTCGQDVTFPDLTGTEFILMECRAFNGTPPLTMAVYKDGELIPGASFPYTIAGADRDAFGTYTFVLSTEICDTDTAVINVLRQGQLFKLNIFNLSESGL